jgi:hypothetical protein
LYEFLISGTNNKYIYLNGKTFNIDGGVVKIQVNLNASVDGTSPVLSDLEVKSVQGVMKCDVNNDSKYDISDILNIFFAIGQKATGPGDPRDWDSDGIITIIDSRGCVLECDNPFWAPDKLLR